MRAFLILALSGAALVAQTPPPAKSTPAKTPAPAAKTGVATKAPAAKAGTATKTGTPAAPRPNPLLNPASLRAIAPPLYRVRFTTTKGDFVVEVHREWAPLGADRFWNLVRNRFFNDAPFFRYVPNFIVQFGIPANPAVAKAWHEAIIKDDPVKQGNKEGTLVFATAGPNTRTTQLFINFKDNSAALDNQGFAAFGTVTEGLEVAKGVFSGYGEAPDQNRLRDEGKAYVDKNFPKLDRILSTTVIFPEPAAPAVKKAAPSTKTGVAPPSTKTGGAPPQTKTGAAPPPPPPVKK
jgi:peptidyl-prolyl cis-trans isomerase A (cyclophilin A)